ncbi:facilitated trehalose transporter Tret1-like [Chrysoperla carnea]|uniref:facilitated trehalose transporter Tret1-like n=1 Tax=Chrysoperla carnea TaxID=189513 RepID=UPI001D06496C|nr:facilitated trehalose transporter Tret1-like [Chrysoperla carnea]XP_044730000.1 facilitated trehalose transporter Tret1-like [Chrysoperla carnea]XP_044730001.1 facilitated trehalose transporter Tret1-like [Chrysoperla carnea]
MNEKDNEANSVLVSSTEEKPYNSTTEPIERPLLQINWKQAWPQIAASSIALSTVIQSGVQMAYSAILLPQLNEDDNIKIDINAASWLASCLSLALPLASFATGPLVDKFGRKNICIFSCIPFLISYLSFYYAQSLLLIFIGRILSGFAGGFTTAALIYASEVSTTELRPIILCFNSIAVALGILITCVLSLWFNWRSIAAICGIITIITILLLFMIPESPQWCAVFKKDQRAILKVSEWFYPDPILYNRETKALLRKLNDIQESSSQAISFRTKFKNLIEDYKDPIVYKPFIILATIFLLQQLTGCYVIIFYAVDIFNSIGGHLGVYADAYVSLVLLGSIRFIIAVIVAIVSKRIGRRQLLIVSSTGMGLSTLCIVISMILHPDTQKEQNGNPFILICVLAYVSFSAFGLLVIPWSLIGELLPVKVRGKLGGLMISIAYICMFIALKLWPIYFDQFGALIMFTFLTVICFTMSTYVYIKLPETLGKSFEEIEGCFK